MIRLLITVLLFFPIVAFAQDIKCPKGYQPYANRCVTQRMADYISCVEASGGNRLEISEEVSEIGGQKASTGIKASGSGAIVKGSGSLLLDKASERTLVKRWETRWFPKGMSECTKMLDNATIKDIKKETTKIRKIQENMLANQHEIKQQNQDILKGQDDIKALFLEKMQKTEKAEHSELIAKYPYGYCLFAIDHRNIIIPNKSVLLLNYDIDWNSAKILSSTENEISIMLPTITALKRNFKLSNVSISGKKQNGMFKKVINMFETKMVIESLEVTDKGIVALIGFGPVDDH